MRTLVITLALALVACGSKPSKAKEKQERAQAAAAVKGLDAIPATVRVVVGLRPQQLAASPLVRKKLDEILGRDPEAAGSLDRFATKCGIDPAKDLDQILLALGDRPSDGKRDSLLVATGALDEAKLVACVTASLAEQGEAMTTREAPGGIVVHVTPKVAFTFAAPDTIIVAQREELLLAARDPNGLKVKGDAAMMELIAGADTRASVWGAGRVPPSVGARLLEVAGVKSPPEAMFGQLQLGEGLEVELNVRLAGTEDAKALKAFVAEQLKSYTVIAQDKGLGSVLAKTKVETDGPTFRLSLMLDADEIAKVEQALYSSQKTR